MFKKLTINKGNVFSIIIFLVLLVIMSFKYFIGEEFPLTVEGHSVLGVSWTFRNSVLLHGFPGTWDVIGGTPLGEFHPFPVSYYYTGIMTLICPNRSVVLKLMILLPIMVAGISMYFCIRAFNKNSFGAILSGLIYAFNPYFLLEGPVAGHSNLTFAYMIFPILILAFYRALLLNSRIYLLTAVAFFTLILLTDLQYAFFSIILFLFFSTSFYFWSVIDKRKFSIAPKRIVYFSLFVFFVPLCLILFQIVNWFTIKPEVALKGFDKNEVQMYSASFSSSISLMTDLPKLFHFSLNPFHYWYILMAVFGFFCCRNRFRYFLAFLLVISVIMAMGVKTPVFEFLQSFSPIFLYFRVPLRFLFLVVVAICFLVGYINPRKKKIKTLLLILFILLTLGIFNPPLRWQFFQTFSLFDKSSSVNWAELPLAKDKVLYEWIRDNGGLGRIAYYQLHPGGIPISLFWSTFHRKRTFDAAVPHAVSQRLFDYLNDVNKIKDGESVAKLTGILNIKYLIPRDNADLLVNGAFQHHFEKVNVSKGSVIYENTRLLPFIRTVNYGILVVGDDSTATIAELLKDKKFDPENIVSIQGENIHIEDYDIENLKRFKLIVLSGNYYKDKKKADNIIDIFRNYGQVIICRGAVKCSLESLKLPQANNRAIVIEDSSQRLDSHYYFKIASEGKGLWLILSEPYYSNWRVNIGARTIKTIPAYGVVNAVYVDPGLFGSDSQGIVSGSFYYGRSINQTRSAIISGVALVFFSFYWFYLLLKLLKLKFHYMV